MPTTALERAIALCEGQAGLARRLTEITGEEITQQRIWAILHRGQKYPAELVIPTERATDGQVTRFQLRPDLYPLDERDAPTRATAEPREVAP